MNVSLRKTPRESTLSLVEENMESPEICALGHLPQDFCPRLSSGVHEKHFLSVGFGCIDGKEECSLVVKVV